MNNNGNNSQSSRTCSGNSNSSVKRAEFNSMMRADWTEGLDVSRLRRISTLITIYQVMSVRDSTLPKYKSPNTENEEEPDPEEVPKAGFRGIKLIKPTRMLRVVLFDGLTKVVAFEYEPIGAFDLFYDEATNAMSRCCVKIALYNSPVNKRNAFWLTNANVKLLFEGFPCKSSSTTRTEPVTQRPNTTPQPQMEITPEIIDLADKCFDNASQDTMSTGTSQSFNRNANFEEFAYTNDSVSSNATSRVDTTRIEPSLNRFVHSGYRRQSDPYYSGPDRDISSLQPSCLTRDTTLYYHKSSSQRASSQRASSQGASSFTWASTLQEKSFSALQEGSFTTFARLNRQQQALRALRPSEKRPAEEPVANVFKEITGYQCTDSDRPIRPTAIPPRKRPAPNPTEPKPSTPRAAEPKPLEPRPTPPKPTSQKPSTPRAATPKPSTPRATSTKPSTPRATSAKPTSPKRTAPKQTSKKPTTPRTTQPKPSTPKSTSTKPTAPKPTSTPPPRINRRKPEDDEITLISVSSGDPDFVPVPKVREIFPKDKEYLDYGYISFLSKHNLQFNNFSFLRFCRERFVEKLRGLEINLRNFCKVIDLPASSPGKRRTPPPSPGGYRFGFLNHASVLMTEGLTPMARLLYSIAAAVYSNPPTVWMAIFHDCFSSVFCFFTLNVFPFLSTDKDELTLSLELNSLEGFFQLEYSKIQVSLRKRSQDSRVCVLRRYSQKPPKGVTIPKRRPKPENNPTPEVINV